MTNKPGYDLALQMGYELHNYSGNGSKAGYSKQVSEGVFIFLDVYDDSTCEISAVCGLVQITTGNIQWPHPNFSTFENQVKRIAIKASER